MAYQPMTPEEEKKAIQALKANKQRLINEGWIDPVTNSLQKTNKPLNEFETDYCDYKSE